MNEEMKIIIRAITQSAQEEINRLKQELEQLQGSAKGASGKMSASFKAMGKGAAVAVAAVAAIGAALVALGKSTLQFNKEQARLISAFEAAGASAQQATEAYSGLYRFLGDPGKASEAAAHLAQITTNQQHLAEWTKIAQGVYATFGDSLPIESLTEAANETIRVGQVTGAMADALNWAGVSEDEFNAKLATTNSLSEREALVRSTLNGLYQDAANIYERNNQAMLAYNESQAQLDIAMGNAGRAMLPLMTALNNLGAAFFTALKPALDAIIPPIAAFVNWIAKAIQGVMSFFSALTGKSSSIKTIGEIGAGAKSAASGLNSAAGGAKNLSSGLGGTGKAAQGAAKAIEEAKKTTQGFDELNIVSSGSSSSGGSSGSGGGGGGSSAPGYASGGGGSGLLDTAAFETEVTESEGLASSLADKVKETFGKLAEVFAPSIEAWSGAFETVKQSWEIAKPSFINGAQEIAAGFATLGTYLISDFIPNVVNSFSTNLAPVIGDVFGFAIIEIGKQFEWAGGMINRAINEVAIPYLETYQTIITGIFSAIGSAWEKHGAGFLTSVSGLFESLRGHVENWYNNVFKPIFDNILIVVNNVWTNGLQPLVEQFIGACLVIGSELLNLYNAIIAPVVDWILTTIYPIVVNVVNGLIETVGKILIAVSNILSGVINVIKGIIQFIVGVFTGDWGKAWEGIKNIFSGVWDAIKGIIDLFMAVLGGIVDFVVDVLAAAFKIAWEIIKGVWSVVVNFFKGIWDGIVAIFSVVKDWFVEKFKQAWEGIKGIWNGVGDWFKGIWNKITETFGNVKGWFKEKFSAAWEAVKGVFSNWGSFFSGLWDRIKNTFSKLGTSIGDAIGGAVKAGINKIITLIENTINKGINLINKAIDLINLLPGVSVGKINKLKLPRLAKGGIIDSATIAMIGEQGKEAVVPLENNTGWMDKLAERINANNKPTKVILKVGEKELGWATIGAINGITEQTGGLQLVL